MTAPTAIGIDFGGTTIKPALIQDGKILHYGEVIDTVRTGGSNAIIEALIVTVAELRKMCPETVAIGVGLPGPVDSINGIVHRLSNVPGWNDVPLRDVLHKRTGLHTAIENDAKSMTYAEWKYGAARNHRNVVCVTLGTGVGGGLIINGRLYRGSALGAGEIGQMSIDYNGRRGNYANPGALEKYVGNNQIAERAQKLYADAGKVMQIEQCTPAAMDAAAHAGDPIALGLWPNWAWSWALRSRMWSGCSIRTRLSWAVAWPVQANCSSSQSAARSSPSRCRLSTRACTSSPRLWAMTPGSSAAPRWRWIACPRDRTRRARFSALSCPFPRTLLFFNYFLNVRS